MAENTATAAAQGTTLAILQAYPLGTLEVQHIAIHKLRYRVTSLHLNPAGAPYAEGVNSITGADTLINLRHALPILKPFAALCEPLADGTVPAIALAQIIFGDTLILNGELWAGMDWFGNVVVTENGVRLFSITKYWHCDTASGLESGFEAYDYLRANHFAVGLEPDQYIAKSAAGAPTIEKGEAS